MANKPIEVGCRVLVINTSPDYLENIGKIAVAIRFIPANYPHDPEYLPHAHGGWVIRSLSENFKCMWESGRYFYSPETCMSEKCLIRLPDEDDVRKFDKEQELESA